MGGEGTFPVTALTHYFRLADNSYITRFTEDWPKIHPEPLLRLTPSDEYNPAHGRAERHYLASKLNWIEHFAYTPTEDD